MPTGNFNVSGAVFVLDSSEAKSVDPNYFSADENPITVSLNDNHIVNKISPDDVNFNSPLVWKKVVIAYSPSGSEQYKHLTFRYTPNGFQAYTAWSSYSKNGTWSLRNVHITNYAGAILKLGSEYFTAGDDITLTS